MENEECLNYILEEMLETSEYNSIDVNYFNEAFDGNDKEIIDKVIERSGITLVGAYLLYLLDKEKEEPYNLEFEEEEEEEEEE